MAEKFTRTNVANKVRQLAERLGQPFAEFVGEEGLFLEKSGVGQGYRLCLTRDGHESYPFGTDYTKTAEAAYWSFQKMVDTADFIKKKTSATVLVRVNSRRHYVAKVDQSGEAGTLHHCGFGKPEDTFPSGRLIRLTRDLLPADAMNAMGLLHYGRELPAEFLPLEKE